MRSLYAPGNFFDSWGIGARDFDQVRSEMHFLAQRGWLQGYLLKCGGASCSFLIGQRYGQTLYTAAAGVHPAWRSYSAGTVLLLLVVEDLFKETQFGFMTWATMRSTNNILPTKAIRKLSSGFSPGPAWPAVFSVHATRLRSALAPRWNSFISNHESGNSCGVVLRVRNPSAGRQELIDGGAASSLAPNSRFGWLPMVNTNVPPLTMSACLNHTLLYGFPLNVTDCMYRSCGDFRFASSTNSLPFASFTVTRSNNGAPNT